MDPSSVVYTRRFFLIDTLSTYRNNSNTYDIYIRYAQRIQFEVILRPYENEQIYMPILGITYRERALSTILSGSSLATTYIVVIYPR